MHRRLRSPRNQPLLHGGASLLPFSTRLYPPEAVLYISRMTDTSTEYVLVVEDEPDIAALVAYQLTQAGYRVQTARGGDEALRILDRDAPDLVVLDLLIPEVGGLDVLRTIRTREETRELPVLVLTARRQEEDRIRGLELGADDYMAKPFSPRELVLRVQALLRRSSRSRGGKGGRVLRSGPLEVQTAATLVKIDDEEVQLTPTEYRLLVCLLERKGRTQSRQALLEAVWDTTAEIDTRTVDMHVGRLRSKLGRLGDRIETVRGFGYRFMQGG